MDYTEPIIFTTSKYFPEIEGVFVLLM